MFITYDDIPDPSDELDAVDKGNCVQGLLRASNEPSSKKYLMRITDNRKKAFLRKKKFFRRCSSCCSAGVTDEGSEGDGRKEK